MNTKIDRDKMFEVCVLYYEDRGCSPELANTIICGTEKHGKLKWLYEYILAEWQITGRAIKPSPEEAEEREIDLLAIKPHIVERVCRFLKSIHILGKGDTANDYLQRLASPRQASVPHNDNVVCGGEVSGDNG